MSGTVSDEQIKSIVDSVFDKFDKDKNGSLDHDETFNLLNAALQSVNKPAISKEECDGFIKAVDTSGNDMIEKNELYDVFKRILNK